MKRRIAVMAYVSGISLLTVILALAIALVQESFAQAVVESPSFVTSHGKVYPICEPGDSCRDSD